MKKITPFQLIILAVFFLAAIIGVAFFSQYDASPVPKEEVIGNVEIWGTYDARIIATWLADLSDANENLKGITYREFSESSFGQEVLVALAENRAPGLLLLDNTQLYEQYNRIFQLTGDIYPKNTFRQTFLEVAEVYFTDQGILGVPIIVDPVVMFWNRNLFSSAGEVRPPIVWQEFFRLVPIFTERGDNFTINQTALPFGEAVNVTNAKEILSTLIIQTGNPITAPAAGGYISTLVGSDAYPSGVPALSFYTEFANPTTDNYSWNRSLPQSREYFLGGKSAVYFGYASEVKPLQLKNPNLNFDIAEIPQSETAEQKSVYAALYGLFIPNAAPDKTSSFRAMSALSDSNSLEVLQDIVKLATPRRDLAGQTAGDDLFTDIFRREAIYAKTYIDPQDDSTRRIISSMIEGITSGRKSIDEALLLADEEINVLFKK